MANTSFVANQAGIEGVAVISIGLLEALSNVSFSENLFYCRAGSYGYVIKDDVRTTAMVRPKFGKSWAYNTM